MKKALFIFFLFTGMFISVNSAECIMKTQSLSVGNDEIENINTIQTMMTTQINEPEIQNPIPAQINETNINYVNVTPYSYYPNQGYYSRTIGPYGVYTNSGSFGFNYQGFGFNYSSGIHSPIYVNPPFSPPPPPPPPPNSNKPPHNGHHGSPQSGHPPRK